MKKSFILDFAAINAQRCSANDMQLQINNRIHHADIHYWKANSMEAIVQEFDGHYGYLYQYELNLICRQSIPLKVMMPDVHIIYLIQSIEAILLQKESIVQSIQFLPERARYIYLPTGDYRVMLPAGYSKIIGFYFESRIFRNNNDRPFPFLKKILQQHRIKGKFATISPDFRIGPRTLANLKYLFDHLKKNDLNNESFVLASLTQLIQLSKEKVFEEYEQLSSTTILANQVREEIRKHIVSEGQEFRLDELCDLFNKSIQYLGRVHKITFGQSLMQCRKEFLIALAKEKLILYASSTHAAYACGFNSVQQFGKFFKNATGMTTSVYLSRILKNYSSFYFDYIVVSVLTHPALSSLLTLIKENGFSF